MNFPKQSKITEKGGKTFISRQNRFFLDPREQILAQRWARSQKLQVLGNAHSHPNGEAIPSEVDCLWSFSSNLMVIVDKKGGVRSWWIAEDKSLQPIELKNFNHK